MTLTNLPDQLQEWCNQFRALRWSSYYLSKWFGLYVSPFRALVLDVVMIVGSFILFLWVRGAVRLIRYRRQLKAQWNK